MSRKKPIKRKKTTTRVVRPVYQTVLAPFQPLEHNVNETNSQAQRQNFSREINHEQSTTLPSCPLHAAMIDQVSHQLRETMGLNHNVRGRETIPLSKT